DDFKTCRGKPGLHGGQFELPLSLAEFMYGGLGQARIVACLCHERSTSSFRPSASAHLCNVPRVGFNTLPVSSLDRAGASMPIRSATSASANPWDSRAALNRPTKVKIAAKLCRLIAPAGR